MIPQQLGKIGRCRGGESNAGAVNGWTMGIVRRGVRQEHPGIVMRSGRVRDPFAQGLLNQRLVSRVPGAFKCPASMWRGKQEWKRRDRHRTGTPEEGSTQRRLIVAALRKPLKRPIAGAFASGYPLSTA